MRIVIAEGSRWLLARAIRSRDGKADAVACSEMKHRRSEYHQPIAMKKPTSTKRPDGVLTCTTCGWYKARLEGGTPAHYCLHPVNVSVVCGSSKGAYDARKPDGFCGPDADCHTSKVNVDSAAFNRH